MPTNSGGATLMPKSATVPATMTEKTAPSPAQTNGGSGADKYSALAELDEIFSHGNDQPVKSNPSFSAPTNQTSWGAQPISNGPKPVAGAPIPWGGTTTQPKQNNTGSLSSIAQWIFFVVPFRLKSEYATR
jgi:hypothetical protein